MEARKFDTDYRKRLVAKLSAIHDKPSLVELYRIILNDVGDDFSSNSNGIFYDVNRFSDCCIQSLADYVGEKKRKEIGPIVYKPYTAEPDLTGFSHSNKVILGKMRRES
jgi:hypothetical protein